MRRCAGFTLIEVLVAMVVVATGLLGASSVQMFSLQNTNQGYLRSQATAIANDIAERLRANDPAVADGNFATLTTSSAYCATPPVPDCISATCTNAQLAASDFFDVGCSGATQLLPSGGLSVDCDISGAAPMCSILVSWTQRRLITSDTDLMTVAMRIQP